MIEKAFSHYELNKDNAVRFEYPSGYGKHNKKVVLTIYQCEPVAEVYLNDTSFMLIDAGSLYLLESNAFIAHKRNDGQLCGRANGVSRAYIHRLILTPAIDSQVDHINHNPLDNRISNLRECSAKQNNIAKRNSRINETLETGHIGVVHVNKLYVDATAVYKVKHPIEGTYSKSFDCEWEAAEYRDKVIADYFLCEDFGGDWNTLNFINWNTNPEDNDLIVGATEAYVSYMKYYCQEMLEDGTEWLKQQIWAKAFTESYAQKYHDEVS